MRHVQVVYLSSFVLFHFILFLVAKQLPRCTGYKMNLVVY